LESLMDQSRSAHHHPNETASSLVEKIVAFRHRRPYWGARKLLDRLQRAEPDLAWPVASTVGAILKRHHLVRGRHPRRRTPPYTGPHEQAQKPNDLWATDFKGPLRTQDGCRVDPLTITDHHSRYIIRCQAVPKMTTLNVRQVFEQAFREYGLPRAIRSDNGTPFASVGLGGLSQLSIWWIRLGILPVRTRPAHPQDNGRHERMHRTLKQDATKPAAATLLLQQDRFDQFVEEYNRHRPHEALGMKFPSEIYQKSARSYTGGLYPLCNAPTFSTLFSSKFSDTILLFVE